MKYKNVQYEKKIFKTLKIQENIKCKDNKNI